MEGGRKIKLSELREVRLERGRKGEKKKYNYIS